MKNWMKNIICSREWTGIGSGMDRVWSRMTSIKPAYNQVMTSIKAAGNHVMILTFLFLVLGGFTMSAWADNVELATITLDSYLDFTTCKNKKSFGIEYEGADGPFAKTENGSTFTLSKDALKWCDNNESNCHFYLKSGKSCTLSWTEPDGYSISVEKIVINAFAKEDDSKFYIWPNNITTKENKMFEGDKSEKNYTFEYNKTYSFTNDNPSGPIFPGGKKMGIGDCFHLKSTSDESNINKITITYNIGNNYSIRFYGNGSTSGTMSNLSMAYYIPKNLTENGFSRSYDVTYDEDGGSTVADDVATYTFAGWATSAGGSIVYSDEEEVTDLTTTVNGTFDLYAKWSGGTVTLPAAPTKSGYQFAGWYNGDVSDDKNKVGNAGDSYTPTDDVELTAKWVDKNDLTISGYNYTINNESWNKTDAFTFTYADKANLTVNIGNSDVISYDLESNIITAKAIGTSTISFTQSDASTTVKGGDSDEWTITVDSVANTLAVSGSEFIKYVGEEITSVRSSQNSSGTISTTSSNANLAYYDITNNKIVIPNTDSQTLPFADVTITISQAATAKYKFKKHTITLTVQKYDNTLSCSWGSWSKNVGFESVTGVTFSATNSGVGAPDITVTPASGTANATYDDENNRITASYNVASATWTVSQAEDYKYKGASETLTVNVGTIASECYLYYGAGSESTTSNDYKGHHSWTEVGVADKLLFKLKKNGSNDEMKVDIGYKEGNDTKYKGWKIISTSSTDSYEDKEVELPATTVDVEFDNKDTPYMKDVRVTRKTWFDIKNAGGTEITSVTIPTRLTSGSAESATFYVHYSTCASEIKLVSDNDHITFAANGTKNYTFDIDETHVKEITLNYTSASKEEITNAKVYIYTPYDHKVLTISAKTKDQWKTELVYKGEASYDVDEGNIDATVLFEVHAENGDVLASPTISLSSDATDVITTAKENSEIQFECGGSSANITATFESAGVYAGTSTTQEIRVNKLADAITWSKKADESRKIHVWADSDIPNDIAGANTAIATYSSGSSDYLTATKSAGVWTLHAVKHGEVTLTATSAGDCTYEIAEATKTIVIDYCYHSINWEQSFAGITTESIGGGDINLTAVAVDSTGTTTGVAISYSVADESIAEIVDGNKLRIKKQGETTITATTAASTKYAVASQVYDIRVHVPGVNTAACKNNKDRNDVSDNKIVINAPHAVFTFSGDNNITQYYNTDGYVLASNLKNASKTFRFTWTTDSHCSIKVTRISCWVKAYNWWAPSASEGKASFNGGDDQNVGTASLTSTSGDYKHFDVTNEEGFSSGVTLVCKSTGTDFDFYIRNIVIEYEITATTAPTASGETANVGVTVNEGSKNLLDLSTLFTIDGKPSDFNYEYEIKESAYSSHANVITGTDNFWADAIGTYEVRARVKASADHKASGWSEGYASIQVNLLPNTLFVGGVADYSGNMQLNSTLALALTASNTDYAGYPISVVQTEGADKRISYDEESGEVISSTLEGTATWTISQAQSDKYQAAEATFTVNVVANEKTYSGGEIDWTDKDEVTVSANVTIETPVEVYKLIIDGESTVTVTASGGLSIGMGGIVNESGNKITLQSNTDGQTGFLRIDPEYAGAMPEVDVEMYSKAYHDKSAATGSKSKYQCVGAPISDEGVRANTVYPAGTWIYTWDESTEGWTSCRTSMTFEAFKGFETTQKLAAAGKNYTYSGHIVSGHEVKTIDLDYSAEKKGYNLLANSFTAPIDIASFDADAKDGEVDFVNAQQTIYFLNAGTKNQSASPGEGVDAPGKWVGVPINTAEVLAKDGLPRMIPSMQGFWVKATGDNAQLKLDYSRLVWGVDYSGIRANKPLRARKQNAEEELPITGKLKISITAEEGNDYLFMLESERYDAAYEDGYDAYKIPSGGVDIFAVEGEDELGVDATNSIIGTKIGLRTGEEYEYTMKFSRVQAEDDLALLDKEEGKEIDIEEGTEYAFFATQNATITDRFEIVSRGNAPAITTGTDGVNAEVKAQKFIKDNSLYIYKDGVLYNALGERVR